MPNTLRFASATSVESDAKLTVEDLHEQIRQQLQDAPVDLVVAFVSSGHGTTVPVVVDGVRRALRPRVMIACTAEGVIGADEEIERAPAVTLSAGSLPGVDVWPFRISGAELQDTLGTANALANADIPTNASLFLVLADPFTAPMDHVLDSFNKEYPQVPVVGGMASGAAAPGRNLLALDDHTTTDGLVGVALGGDVQADVIVSQGCRPIGPVFRVSEADDNVIASLDGKPPLEQLQEVVQDIPEGDRGLLRNGLFVGRAVDPDKEVLGRGDFLIRGVIGVDQRNGSITIGDYVEAGETVQFHVRDAATAEEDLELLLTPHSLFGKPSGAFLFSCNGRGTRLYDHPNGDISALQRFFPGLSVAGFFCAGEIGPIGGKNCLHGHTASLALLRPGGRTKVANSEGGSK